MMNLQEFVFWQKVYAQTSDVQTTPSFETLDQDSIKCEKEYGELFHNIEVDNRTCRCKGIVKNKKEDIDCSTITEKDFEDYCKSTWAPKYSERVNGACGCANGIAKDADWKETSECLVNKAGTLGIKCTAEQLVNNTCSRNINKTLGIRQSDPRPNPTILLQDVVLWATSFVGTLIMIALLYLGIKAVMAGASDSDEMGDIKSKAKNLVIWFLLIIGSFTIIRLIQYVARGY